MGTVEVADQVAGVRWLAAAGITDAARVGLHGWSYGGYMTLMCLATAPDTFKAGVAGAPVTAWQFYETAYTERYMVVPATNPHYAGSSVVQRAAALLGKPLLIIHGNIDENVHYRNTTALMAALRAAAGGGDGSALPTVIALPGERHGARGYIAAVRNETVAFLVAALTGARRA